MAYDPSVTSLAAVQGMVDSVHPLYHQGRAFRYLCNADRSRGTLRRRDGWARENTTAIPSEGGRISGAFGFSDSAANLRVLVWTHSADGPRVYTNTNWCTAFVPGAGVNDDLSWALGDQVCAVAWGDHIFFTTGTTGGTDDRNGRITFNGDAAGLWGVSLIEPDAAPTVATGTAGNLKGAYYYRVMFYEDGRFRSPAGPVSDVVEPDNEKVELTDIPVSTEANRTIHREIFRMGYDAAWVWVATLEDNSTTTYSDNVAELTGETMPTIIAVPACKVCCVAPDGQMLWANDVENDLPAVIYRSFSTDEPESIDTEIQAGSHSDPITALHPWQDGTFVGKQRSIWFVTRHCADCSRIIDHVGCVSQGSVVPIDRDRVAWLSAEGPRILVGYQVGFAGPDQKQFVLAEQWKDNVDVTQLHLSQGVIDVQKNVIVWKVASSAASSELDLGFVWDYVRNEMWLDTQRSVTQLFGVPAAGGSPVTHAWGAFPDGAEGAYVGRLHAGQHGDGMATLEYGTVVSVSGATITVGSVPSDCYGCNLYIYAGTGAGQYRRILSGSDTDIVVASVFTTEPDATSKYWIGGFTRKWRLDGIGGEVDPTSVKTFLDLDVIYGEDFDDGD